VADFGSERVAGFIGIRTQTQDQYVRPVPGTFQDRKADQGAAADPSSLIVSSEKAGRG